MLEILKNLGTFLFYSILSLGGAAIVCAVLTSLSIRLMDGIDHLVTGKTSK